MAAQGARLACRIMMVRAPVAKGDGTCIMIPTPRSAGGDPAEFGRGLTDGQNWDIDSAVAAGLADPSAR